MMIIRWACFVIYIVCLGSIAATVNGVGTALLALIAGIAFVAFCWTFGAFRRTATSRRGQR